MQENRKRRRERVARGLCALAACVVLGVTAATATPIDVQRSWCATPVNTLLENGVLTAYPDGRFRPDHGITREEAAVLLLRLEAKLPPVPAPPLPTEPEAEAPAPDEATQNASDEVDPAPEAPPVPQPVPEPPSVPTFSDLTPDRWSYEAIQTLCTRGLLSGYPDGRFVPDGAMSRGEFAVLLTRFLDARGVLGAVPAPLPFTDLTDSFAAESVARLCAAGLLSGYPDGSFQPARGMTRGEVAALFAKLGNFPAVPPVVTIPETKVIEVPYISQLYPYNAVVGCEATSLLMGLKGKGYALDIGLPYFLEAMPKTTSNPALGFVGSPYVADKKKLTRTTIYPPVLAVYASQFGPVADLSGASPAELQAELLAGNPVVIYATMRWEDPFYRTYSIEGQPQRLLSNNHAVLLCGYDPAQGYYVADPYNLGQSDVEFRYWKDAATVERLYMERQHAVVVR